MFAYRWKVGDGLGQYRNEVTHRHIWTPITIRQGMQDPMPDPSASSPLLLHAGPLTPDQLLSEQQALRCTTHLG